MEISQFEPYFYEMNWFYFKNISVLFQIDGKYHQISWIIKRSLFDKSLFSTFIWSADWILVFFQTV